MNQNELSTKIKELRTKQGFSQMDLADETGLNLRTIQRIESGKSTPRGDTLRRLATALKVTPDQIIEWEEIEDHNVITMMKLSQFGYIAFPLLGTIIPLLIWVLKKDKVKNVDHVGKKILNFQITWMLLFGLPFILFFIAEFGFFSRKALGGLTIFVTSYICLYIFNGIMIIINTILYIRTRKIKYFPAIRILN